MSLPQRRQAMTSPGAGAGFVTNVEGRVRCEITARAWAPIVDGAAHCATDLALQRNAARRAVVAAAHAHERCRHRNRKRHRHTAARLVFQVGDMKIHPEARAAGATTEAGIRHGSGVGTATLLVLLATAAGAGIVAARAGLSGLGGGTHRHRQLGRQTKGAPVLVEALNSQAFFFQLDQLGFQLGLDGDFFLGTENGFQQRLGDSEGHSSKPCSKPLVHSSPMAGSSSPPWA